MSGFRAAFMAVAGYRQKDWYVAHYDDGILAGPFRTKREARREVFLIAKGKRDSNPWGQCSQKDPDFPSYYTVWTGDDVYYIGLGGALFDQGHDKWCADLMKRP